jgi:hypothetical protein
MFLTILEKQTFLLGLCLGDFKICHSLPVLHAQRKVVITVVTASLDLVVKVLLKPPLVERRALLLRGLAVHHRDTAHQAKQDDQHRNPTIHFVYKIELKKYVKQYVIKSNKFQKFNFGIL